MPSRTSSSAGRSDADKQVSSYVVRVDGMVRSRYPVITRHARVGGWGRGSRVGLIVL